MSGVPGTTTLLAEANHRIANSLAAISGIVRLQGGNERRVSQLRSPGEVRIFLSEISARIDSAAHLHRFLASCDHGSYVDICEYVRNVARTTVGVNAVTGLNELHFDGRTRRQVSADDALSIGLIVVELITNALKYAHPSGVGGNIVVSCFEDADDLVIEVADDGIGLPESFDWSSDSSLGYRLIRSLTRQLDGELSIVSNATEEIGVRATLKLPRRAVVPFRAYPPEAEPA